MRYIKLSKNNRVVEIIPEFDSAFPTIPLSDRFSANFISNLIPIEDDSIEIKEGLVYDKSTGTFSEYVAPTPVPTVEQRVKELEASNTTLTSKNEELASQNKLLTEQIEALSSQLDFQEECIVEMAGVVYA